MAKNILPTDIATVIFAECVLAAGGHQEGVWEITLTAPMIMVSASEEERICFPTGTVFYMPFGQMELWQRTAMALGAAASDELAAGHRIGTLAVEDAPLGQVDVPF